MLTAQEQAALQTLPYEAQVVYLRALLCAVAADRYTVPLTRAECGSVLHDTATQRVVRRILVQLETAGLIKPQRHTGGSRIPFYFLPLANGAAVRHNGEKRSDLFSVFSTVNQTVSYRGVAAPVRPNGEKRSDPWLQPHPWCCFRYFLAETVRPNGKKRSDQNGPYVTDGQYNFDFTGGKTVRPNGEKRSDPGPRAYRGTGALTGTTRAVVGSRFTQELSRGSCSGSFLLIPATGALPHGGLRVTRLDFKDSESKANALEKTGLQPAPATRFCGPPESDSYGGNHMPTAKAILWKAGVQLFASYGIPESKSRPFIGKLVGAYGSDHVGAALGRAIVNPPIEPFAYLTATAKAMAARATVKEQTQADRGRENMAGLFPGQPGKGGQR